MAEDLIGRRLLAAEPLIVVREVVDHGKVAARGAGAVAVPGHLHVAVAGELAAREGEPRAQRQHQGAGEEPDISVHVALRAQAFLMRPLDSYTTTSVQVV